MSIRADRLANRIPLQAYPIRMMHFMHRVSLTRTVRAGPFGRATRVGWLGIGLLMSVVFGCQSGIYSPANLPPQYDAVNPVDVGSLDLSQLAGIPTRNDVIQPGDVLEITIATGLEEGSPVGWPVRTTEAGTVNVPNVGVVRVAGLSLTEAEMAIRTESIRRSVFRDPSVSVLLADRRSNQITVLGPVNQPGIKELPLYQSNLLGAIVAAGGLSSQAGTLVEIRMPGGQQPLDKANADNASVRDAYPGGLPVQQASYGTETMPSQPTVVRVDLARLGEQPSRGQYIPDGSVVNVEHRSPQVIRVIGLVNRPNQFELPLDQEVRLLDALAMAGGRTIEIADKVHVVRNPPGGGEPIVIRASVRKAKHNGEANIRLAAGDLVSVEQTPATLVLQTLRGFVRFGFSSGLPLF